MFLNRYTQTQQNNFASFCKTNVLKPIDHLTKNRIHYYRRLIRGVIDDSLRSAYPLTENLLTIEEWDFVVDEFIAKHKSQSPQIWQMPFEFYQFISENDFAIKVNYPHLTDLLLFEWKEIEIYMMEDKNDDLKNLSQNFKNESRIILNREYEIVQLSFPVHTKQSSNITSVDKGIYYVLMFRADDKVQFFDLSSIFVWLVYEIEESNSTVEGLIKTLSGSNDKINDELIRENIYKFIEAMHSKGFILGFENTEEIK